MSWLSTKSIENGFYLRVEGPRHIDKIIGGESTANIIITFGTSQVYTFLSALELDTRKMMKFPGELLQLLASLSLFSSLQEEIKSAWLPDVRWPKCIW